MTRQTDAMRPSGATGARSARAWVDPVDFLAALPARVAAPLLATAHRRRWDRGATLITGGAHPDTVLVLSSGRVKLCVVTADGREVILAIRAPGALLGEVSVLSGQPQLGSVVALEPVEALAVPAGAFIRYVHDHPPATWALLRVLAERVHDADHGRFEFGAFDTLGRLVHRLVELADRFGEPTGQGTRIALPVTQDELAGWVGASREAVVKGLRALRSRHHVLTGRRAVTIRNLEALRRSA